MVGSAALSYLAFTVALAALLAAIAIHFFSAKRKDRVESPKYRMLEEDDDTGGDRP